MTGNSVEAGRVQALGFSNFEICAFETDRWVAIANMAPSWASFFLLKCFYCERKAERKRVNRVRRKTFALTKVEQHAIDM